MTTQPVCRNIVFVVLYITITMLWLEKAYRYLVRKQNIRKIRTLKRVVFIHTLYNIFVRVCDYTIIKSATFSVAWIKKKKPKVLCEKFLRHHTEKNGHFTVKINISVWQFITWLQDLLNFFSNYYTFAIMVRSTIHAKSICTKYVWPFTTWNIENLNLARARARSF